MAASWTRRRRLILLTAGGAGVLAFVTASVILMTRTDDTYLPGQGLEGLTTRLNRDLPPDYPRVTFDDVTDAAGVVFHHFQGRRTSQLPEDMGSGAAWGDYDNDGWLDLYVVNSVGPLTLSPPEVARAATHAALYRNNGDGTFADVTDQTGVGFHGWGMGAEWADADNDGDLDLFVTAYGHNVFYRNNSNGSFTDGTQSAGLESPSGFWSAPAWGDYDRDGYLDLYVTGYVQYAPGTVGDTSRHYDVTEPASINPSSFPPERNLLYHNEGDGTFTEVAVPAGVANADGKGLEATWTDFDEDGWPDLYIANDVSDNVLYRNLGNGTFEDVSHAARVADYRGAMGIAVGDWDGDLDLDMVVTHWIAQENALYTNRLKELASGDRPNPSGLQFMDEADRYGLGQIALDFIGWGAGFLDYDNDGRLDLFVVNGSTFQQRDAPHLLVPMRDQLFWNRSNSEGFFDVSPVSGPYFERSFVGRGAAFADYDRDGSVDVFIVNNGGPGVLLRNRGGERAWLEVQLEGRRSNRSAIGARLRLVANRQSQIREVGSSPSYLSQDALVQHFGLGAATTVDTLQIWWPSGGTDIHTGVPVNQLVTYTEGARQ